MATKLKPMVHYIPITKARVNLGQVVKRVHLNKEYFILEKDGIPVAGIINVDELEDYLELQNPKVRAHIKKSYAEYQAGKSRPADALLDELTQKAGRTKPKTSSRKRG